MIAYSKKTLAGLMIFMAAAWVNYQFEFVFLRFAEAPPEIVAARLIVLRRAQPADAQGLYLLARNVDVMRYMDWPMPTDPMDTESHLREVSADWDAGAAYLTR